MTELIPVWGVDPQVSHVAFARVTGREAFTDEVFCSSMETPVQRLAELYLRVKRYVELTAGTHGKPACVAVELPVGRFPSPILTMAAGVICLACAHGLLTVPVWWLPPAEWKRHAGVPMPRGKPQVRLWAEGRASNALGQPLSQDECDALGIAVAAQSMLGLEVAA